MSDAVAHIFDGERNLSMGERALSVALGLGIAAASVRRPNALGLVALAAGAALALRGAYGYCPVKAALGDNGPERIAYDH
jgi:hypothetical protein